MSAKDITPNDPMIELHLKCIMQLPGIKSIHLLVNDGSSVNAYGACEENTYTSEQLSELNNAAQLAFKNRINALKP